MAWVIKDKSKVAVVKETVQGVYAAPVNSDFVETTEAGATIEKSREALNRTNMTGNRIKSQMRLANKSVSVTMECELKAADVRGDEPEFSEMIESLGMANVGFDTDIVSTTAHTTSVINIDSGDIDNFKVNDIVMIMQTNNYHVSPIIAVGATSITLEVTMSSAPSDGVVISKNTQYQLDETVDQTCSVTRIFDGDNLQERATGCRTESISLQNFGVGKIPTLSFKMAGLNYADLLDPTSFEPDYSQAIPSYVHNACLFKNGVEVFVSEIGISIEQTVSKISTTCAENGAIASRGTGVYKVTVTINPYKDQDVLGFGLDEDVYSLFFSIANPTNPSNTEKENVIAFYIPKVMTTKSDTADVDGVLTDAVSAEGVPTDVDSAIRIAFF